MDLWMRLCTCRCHTLYHDHWEALRACLDSPIWLNFYKKYKQVVGWPSGLRRWFKAPVISMAWVRIPPLPVDFFFSLSLSLFSLLVLLTEFPLPQFWWLKLEDILLCMQTYNHTSERKQTKYMHIMTVCISGRQIVKTIHYLQYHI